MLKWLVVEDHFRKESVHEEIEDTFQDFLTEYRKFFNSEQGGDIESMSDRKCYMYMIAELPRLELALRRRLKAIENQ